MYIYIIYVRYTQTELRLQLLTCSNRISADSSNRLARAAKLAPPATPPTTTNFWPFFDPLVSGLVMINIDDVDK